ncbi:mycofactocin precursor MftA [Streptomyces boluensis]|uniref:Mycofactocin n=1 Tax=Streptomyces boluensis TaxID=1775135 RepID=A0A964ULP2_9ACTN|nr:mycofactocin precursor MftA [Streptomyces boluensis]NBE50023.1 mycofactocin precursor [Streptomyces boluensis]
MSNEPQPQPPKPTETTSTACAGPSPAEDDRLDDRLIEEDLLVEEVSIDGMCGVY